ncbi:MAG: hypothetical protein Q4C53_01410 [Clostridia bacterium]|nr:hypothetical protein [Clostridia bacterium]
MKSLVLKWMAVLLVLAMAFPAFAEEFALRNGILFGDKKEVVFQKEKTLKRESSDSNWFQGKIAGYVGASCGFYFDNEDKLESVCYSFGPAVCYNSDEMNSVYKTLTESLKRKYGNPIGNTGGLVEPITGPAFESLKEWYDIMYKFWDNGAVDYINYDEWAVDCGNYNVKIDIVSFYVRKENYNYQYFVYVSYHKYTEDDYKEAANEAAMKANKEREEVDNDM